MSNISIYSTSRLVNCGHLFISTSCMSPLFQKGPRTSWLLPSLRDFADSAACVNYQRDELWYWLPAPTRSSLSLSSGAFTFPLEDLLLSEKNKQFPQNFVGIEKFIEAKPTGAASCGPQMATAERDFQIESSLDGGCGENVTRRLLLLFFASTCLQASLCYW